MSNPPPLASSPPVASYALRSPAVVDAEHLRILAICHYIWAALLVPFACFGLIYVGMGAMMASGKLSQFQPPAPAPAVVMTNGTPTVVTPPPVPARDDSGDKIVGYFFIGFGGLFVVLGLTLAVLTLVAGRSISKRRRRLLVLIVAGANCLMFPFGTALGVFTLIVVLRDSVRAAFDPTSRIAEPVG